MLRLVEYAIVRGMLAVLRCVGYPASLRLADAVGRLAYRFDATPRERALHHLNLAYGASLAPAQAEKVARGVFQTICRHVAEVAHATRQAKIGLRIENPELLKEAYARGRGVVVVSAHMGCWIRMAVIPHLLGVRGSVIMKKQRNDVLLQWGIRYLKRHFDMDIIQKKDARDQVVEFLQEGRVVTMFADQHPRRGGFPARFFGREVTAAAGPAVYAKRFDCPLLVFTSAKHADGTQVLRFDGPISTAGSYEEVSQRWLDLLEARIREHPEQWMWMHRRWRGPGTERADSPTGVAPAVSSTAGG
jgi:KDO2-lipid IV(A) lauroyltransferase